MNKTSIELTKQQYATLLRALGTAGAVYAVLGDMVDDGYKNISAEFDDLEEQVLRYAGEYGAANKVEAFDGRWILSEAYLDTLMDDLSEYEDYVFWDLLAHNLSDRDLDLRYTEAELEAMTDREFALVHQGLEASYRQELDANGVSRLRVKKAGELQSGS